MTTTFSHDSLSYDPVGPSLLVRLVIGPRNESSRLRRDEEPRPGGAPPRVSAGGLCRRPAAPPGSGDRDKVWEVTPSVPGCRPCWRPHHPCRGGGLREVGGVPGPGPGVGVAC